jgi:CubicO group peptidase (beta-lactamase class C family)
VAAYLDGELVVDTWAGAADEVSGRPVDHDTLFMISSTGKGMTATLMHMLADRGQLDYEAPIARYWPEFATNGKGKATIRDALSHKAGVPRIDGQTPDLVCDWDRMCATIADAVPLFEPGTKTSYHSWTFGYILGEVLRRIDGRPINQFMQEDLCTPLGIESLFFGIPDELIPRVARLKDSPQPEPAAGEPRRVRFGADFYNQPRSMLACIPAMGGISNARSIARHYAMLANGGVLDGVRLLTPERIEMATTVQTEEVDLLAKVKVIRSMGYRLEGYAGGGVAKGRSDTSVAADRSAMPIPSAISLLASPRTTCSLPAYLVRWSLYRAKPRVSRTRRSNPA